MQIFWLILGVVLLWPSSSEAACTGSSPTWTAASASRTDVSDCVAAVSSGDRINVPPGSATWDSAVDISGKDLTIIGAGSGSNTDINTVITMTSGNCFTIGKGGTSSSSRISRFRFVNCMIGLDGLNPGKPFHIDHNYFQSSVQRTMRVSGYNYPLPPRGLFDHNVHELTRFVIYGTMFMLNEANWQHLIWATDPDFGGPQAVYIEDCIITNGPPGTIDSNYGGRYVYRFNTVTVDTYAHEFHGVQSNNRAGQRWEIYGNSVTTTASSAWASSFLRGATGFMFNNTRSGTWTNGAVLKVERSSEDKLVWGFCDGTKIIDGNTPGFRGWPCRDQIGRSRDSAIYSGSGAWPPQASTPAYSWNNTQGGSQWGFSGYKGNSIESTLHSLVNRDWFNYNAEFNGTTGVGIGMLSTRPVSCTTGVAYWATDDGEWNSRHAGTDGQLYKCTATNTWTLYYTPYSYPHPLQATQGDSTPPAAPINLTVKNPALPGGAF